MSSDALKKTFHKDCVFLRAMRKDTDFFVSRMPEFAFIGRSNVGKSSLINALVNRKVLARVGKTPGCTKQINVFGINNTFLLMDMPGYGYAKSSKEECDRWLEVSLSYFLFSGTLKRIFILVDARHGLKISDEEIMSWLDQEGLSYAIVLTKIDKISDSALVRVKAELEDVLKQHPAAYVDVICTSSEKKKGVNTLQGHIKALL